MKRKKFQTKLKVLLLSLTLLLPLFFQTIPTFASFESYENSCYTSVDGTENDGIAADDGNSGAVGDWSKEGSKSYNIAKKVWDYWKGKGFNGSAISGVMGNIDHEGGFDIPDRAEGHYGGDSKTDGISSGVVPSVGSGYPVGASGKPEGGAGHYQFTPYSKFAPLGDSKWLDSDKQSDFVWTSEVKSASWRAEYSNSSSPEQASKDWFKYYERGASYNPAKDASAKKAYEVFGGASIPNGSAIDDAEDAADDGSSDNTQTTDQYTCGQTAGESTGKSDSDIINIARTMLGYFSYLQVHGESYIGSVENIDKNGITDCSGFIWLALAKSGKYQIPADMAWYTASMRDDAKKDHKYLKEIKPSEAGAGDIVIVNTGDGAGNNGHTAFLTEKWKDAPDAKNSTKVIEMGGASHDGVNESTFDMAFTSLLRGSYDITFARPIEKK